MMTIGRREKWKIKIVIKENSKFFFYQIVLRVCISVRAAATKKKREGKKAKKSLFKSGQKVAKEKRQTAALLKSCVLIKFAM